MKSVLSFFLLITFFFGIFAQETPTPCINPGDSCPTHDDGTLLAALCDPEETICIYANQDQSETVCITCTYGACNLDFSPCSATICATCCPPPGANGDPHFIGFHNQRYDFHGLKDSTFLIYSDPQIFINAELVDGSWKKEGSTYMGALGIQLGPNKMTVSAHEGIHFLPFTRISERESIIKLDGCGHVKIDGTFQNGKLVQWKRVIIDYEEYDIVITRSVPAESKTPEESAYLNIQKISIPKSVIKASGVLGQSLSMENTINVTSNTWLVKGDILSTKCKATTFTNAGNRYTTNNCPEAAQTFYVKRVASSMD